MILSSLLFYFVIIEHGLGFNACLLLQWLSIFAKKPLPLLNGTGLLCFLASKDKNMLRGSFNLTISGAKISQQPILDAHQVYFWGDYR
jgi:hypothetical protein